MHTRYSPVITYCESLEKAQSQTHFLLVPFLSVFRSVKSAVDQILHVPSADVVANKLQRRNTTKWHPNSSSESATCHSLNYYRHLLRLLSWKPPERNRWCINNLIYVTILGSPLGVVCCSQFLLLRCQGLVVVTQTQQLYFQYMHKSPWNLSPSI